MTRVLVKTGNPAWFVDVANPEGKKVRRQDDDQIFDNLIEGQEALSVLRAAHGSDAGDGNGGAPENTAASKPATKASANGKAQDKPAPKPVKLSTGKTVVGKTVEIQCAWKGKDDGTGENGKRCQNRRVIKVQDQFQVRYCEHHQAIHRRNKRNARARARTAERQAAKK